MRANLVDKLTGLWRRWFGRPDVPPDPHARIGAPRKRPPSDRAGAVALEEPPR